MARLRHLTVHDENSMSTMCAGLDSRIGSIETRAIAAEVGIQNLSQRCGTIETAVAEACVSARLFTQSRWKETTGRLTNTLLNYWPDAAPDELAEAFDKMTDPATYEDAVEKIRFVAGSWGREMRITTVTERAS